MFKGQLGISAAILAILVTIGAFFLVSSDGNQKADQEAKAQVSSAYHVLREVLALDAQTSRTMAAHYARMSSAYFKAVRRYRQGVGEQIAKATGAMEEGWAPDFVGVVSTQRIMVFSQLNSTASKPGTPLDFGTNRVVENKFITTVLTKKGGATLTGPMPWASVLTGKMKAVAVPLLGAGGVPVGALVLSWKDKNDDRAMKTHAETFRDKLDVVSVLMPRQKIDRNLAAMLRNEFPEDLQKKHGIKVAFIGLLDRHGILVARNDQSRLFLGEVLQPKSLAIQTARAQHWTTTEVWLKSAIQDISMGKQKEGDVRPEIIRVGVAPMMTLDDKLQGLLLLAWELDDVHATHMRTLSGAEVAYLHGKTLSTTTLKAGQSAALARVPKSDQGPGEWKPPTTQTITLGDATYYAAASTFPTGPAFSFVVFSSVDARKAKFGFARIIILLLGGLMVVCILLVTWLLRRYFILPLSELEKGVADIVAGNMEYTFGVPSRETEGLAYSLNVLMAQLLGRPEPGEEDEEEGENSGGPQMRFSLGPLPDRAYRPGDSQLIPRLDEAKDAYYQRIFGEYVAAMQQLGEDTTGFEVAGFRRKLEVNERMICARLKCSEVRFAVVAGEEEVMLQPYPVA